MALEIPDPQTLIDVYGLEAPVIAGRGEGISMMLGQALQFEAEWCKADPADRQDPIKRAVYIATMLARGSSLRPEDEYLLSISESE